MQNRQLKKENLKKERYKFLRKLERTLEVPMILLAVMWLILFISRQVLESKFLSFFFYLIWIFFIFEFLMEFFVAPRKMYFLKRNMLIMLSLFIPPLRVLRVFSAYKKQDLKRRYNLLHPKDKWNKR